LSCIESQSSQGARQLPRKSSSVQNRQLRVKMAMRHERPETVMEKVVKGAFEDVVSGSKWVWDKVSSYSFDDNVKTSPLTKKEIMSPMDIPCLGETVEEDSEDEEVMYTVTSLSEASGKLQLAETTGKLSSTNNIVHLQGDTVEDAPCLQNESLDEAFKDMVGSKVSNPWEGIENVSHAEIHFSVYENVAKHVHNGGNTIAKVEDSPSVYYYSPSPGNSQEAVPVLEAVDLSPIEPMRRLLLLPPEFEDSNLMDGNIVSRNSILDPVSIPRKEEDEFIYNLPNAVIHKGSKLYQASPRVWVAEPIVQKSLCIDK